MTGFILWTALALCAGASVIAGSHDAVLIVVGVLVIKHAIHEATRRGGWR